jgi:predicted PurR-regulated permease PerM
MGHEYEPAVAAEPPSSRQRAGLSGRTKIAWIVGAILLAVLLWLAIDVLLLFFASVLLALFLRGISNWLSQHTPLSEGLALAVTVLTLAAVTAGVIWLVAPRIAEQLDELAATLPGLLQQWRESLQQHGWGRWLMAQMLTANGSLGGGDLLAKVGSVFSSTFGAVIDFVLILIMGLYLAAEAGKYKHGLVLLFPRERRARALVVLTVLGSTLQRWFLAQTVSVVFLGVFAFIGLSLLGIPLAFTLALFTALLTFIPNLGAIISVIPPVVLALAEKPILAVYVILFYIVLQSMEGYFITPMVQRHAILLPPALLITTQLLLALLLGFFGLVLAAPLSAVGLVLVKMLYLEDVLGERIHLPGYSGST